MPSSSAPIVNDPTPPSSLRLPAGSDPLIDKCTPHTVSAEELRLTGKLFRDLASRSGGNTIDKTTFLMFFPLPVCAIQGLWGERLFERFDRKRTGSIDYEDFAHGLSLCTKSSREEKLKFLFSLYDLRDDGYIDKAELVTMVQSTQMHNTYKHTLRDPRASEVSVDLPEENRDMLLHKESVSSVRRSTAALIHRDDSMLPEQIEHLVAEIMSKLDAGEKINFDQFVTFIDQNPRIMEVFTGVFHEDVWTKRSVHMRPRRALSCLCFDSHGSRSPKAKVAPDVRNLSGSQNKSGWLLQRTRISEDMRKVFAVLRGNMLMLYPSSAAPLATSVIFLEGCYIDPLHEFSQGNDHGFSITHQFEGFRPMSFWTSARSERDTWVARIRIAAKSRKVDEYYDFKERLGSGKFSDVYLAIERTTDFRWAVKVIDKLRLNESEKEMLRSEIAIMKLLNHPNVVEMKEVFEDKSKMYVVLELVEGGELFERIRKKRVFSEYMAYHITKQLLETIKYLHSVGIVHRDIKPENILLSDSSDLPTIKIADFGLSKLIGPNDRLDVPCGTLAYVAPEVLMMQPYSLPVDIWSIGVVCYLMVRGRLPFDSKDKQVLIEKTIEARVDLTGPYWSKLTHFCKDFLEKLLTKNSEERVTSEQALTHNWIKNGDVIIPRKINRRAVEEDLMTSTLTNARIGSKIYDERSKAARSLDAMERMIYTTPDIYEDMEVERKAAEHRILLS